MTDYPRLNRCGQFPPGHFRLRQHLGAICGPLYELRIDVYPDAPFYARLGVANEILMDLILDDEFGLIGATPKQRVAFMECGS
ncbi:MAG: hypothetical protein ACX94B_16920 [Henriciella sp.]